MPSSALTPLAEDLFLVKGSRQILQLAPALQELSRRTGQLGAMHWLEYFFETPSLTRKPPYLVLQMRAASNLGELHPDQLIAAALFFEYRVGGLCTRIFSTDDAVGFRTIIAASEERASFAQRAAHALLGAGAQIVLATYEAPHEIEPLPRAISGALLGYRQRRVGRMLTLAPTYDETLAHMGRLTRRNLRYYRRHLASRCSLTYVADARRTLTFAEFMRLNQASLNPVRSQRELWLRWRSSCQLPGGFLAGLRSGEGKWLSLIGGWRHETTTVMHWQLNSAGYEHDSIGVVMRSFFLEHEIEHGARKLLMSGGTPHSIRHAFDEDSIADLLVCRPSARFFLLRSLAHLLMKRSKRVRNNHLFQLLAGLPLNAHTPNSAETATALESPSPETSQAA